MRLNSYKPETVTEFQTEEKKLYLWSILPFHNWQPASTNLMLRQLYINAYPPKENVTLYMQDHVVTPSTQTVSSI